MKRSKKKLLLGLGGILLAIVIGAVCVVLRAAPTVNHALRISALLQPVLDAENQTMHVAMSAEIADRSVAMESDLYLVTENETRYLCIERNGNAVYLADDVLFLANGKAFKLGGKLRTEAISCRELLPKIGALYDVLKITAEETEKETSYFITVTAEQVEELLPAIFLGESVPVEGIEKLNLCLTERDGKLDRITFSGGGASGMLNVTLSGFRILAPGDYPVPTEVQQRAATVDPEELFSLTEDLYPLAVALAPFADIESVDGTLVLNADCGLIQLDTQMQLSDLKTNADSRLDPENLQVLPEMLGWLCMEGEISCVPKDDGFVYTLELDEPAMQELSRMILPELAQYGCNLTEGSAAILLESGAVASMKVSLRGKISAWIAQIPVAISAEFIFE